MLDERHHFSGGAWLASTGTPFEVVNPASGEPFARVTGCSAADVDRAVRAARAAFAGWAATSVDYRLALLQSLRDALAAESEVLAALITRQMGTPIAFARTAQIGLPVRTFDLTIAAMRNVADEPLGRSTVIRDPVGVVAAITPWNFPLHQIAAKVAPALAAGCTVILKPSEATPLDALAFARLVEACGFPAGVFNLVTGAVATGMALVAHPDVDMISFTGSTAAGRHIAAAAGTGLKKVALELGGKSANIMLDDVDLTTAVPAALGQCFVNAGQTCAALTRLIVPGHRLAEVEAIAFAALEGWRAGDPADPDTRLGPLSSARQRDRAQGLVDRAAAQSARVVGGTLASTLNVNGAWFAPTLICDARPDMEIAREEVFAPVLVLLGYRDEDDAVAIANGTDYGLSGGVWSAIPARAEAVARRLRTGQVVLNGAMLDMEAPFGGTRASGIGREYGRFGLEEFFTLKAVTRQAA